MVPSPKMENKGMECFKIQKKQLKFKILTNFIFVFSDFKKMLTEIFTRTETLESLSETVLNCFVLVT